MCIGVPMRIVSSTAHVALGEGRGQRQQLDLMLLGEVPAGTWVLAFRGAALRVLTPDEAGQIDAALDALDTVLAGGDDVDACFPDLADREPTLPEHLRGGRK
jgi:hydrogenase expression/formation protein HypC